MQKKQPKHFVEFDNELFSNALEAAKANPDLLPEDATMWPATIRSEDREEAKKAALQALRSLTREEFCYINMKVNNMTVRAMGRVMNVHYTTANTRLQQAVAALRRKTAEFLAKKGLDF